MSSGTGRRRALRIADWVIICGLCVTALLSLSDRLPAAPWWWALLGQTRPQLMTAAVVATAWLLARERRIWTSIALAVALLNLAVLAPFYFDQESGATPDQTLSVLHLNTSRGAADLSGVESFAADLVFLQEVTPELERQLREGSSSYRLVRSEPRDDTRGSALLIRTDSPLEVLGSERHQLLSDHNRPLLSVEISFAGRRIQLLSLHVIRPRNRSSDAQQQAEFDAIAAWSRQQIARDKEVVLVGDFNATPWSRRFKEFLSDSQTRDSMPGFGIQNSWAGPFPIWMGLPIDHATCTRGLQVIRRQTAAVDGSDHGLLVVEFSVSTP